MLHGADLSEIPRLGCSIRCVIAMLEDIPRVSVPGETVIDGSGRIG